MLKLLCLVACFITSNAFANNYIRVVGEGVTVEAAKENGFREAVQIRAGAVVLSERESTIDKLVRDDINVYSAGYVRDYNIILTRSNNDRYSVTMDVLIQDSKLFNQTLSSGKSNREVDGSAMNASYQSYLSQRTKGDRLLNRVLSTYPQNALIVSQDPASIAVDQYRNIIVRIPYQLTWNYDYIIAFNEAMQLFDDDRFGRFTPAPSNVVVMGKNPKDFVIGSSTQYRFNDIIMLDRIKDSVTGDREVRLMISLRDDVNNTVYRSCAVPNLVNGGTTFYGVGDPRYFVIHGNAKEQGVLQVYLKDRTIVDRIRAVDLAVVATNKC